MPYVVGPYLDDSEQELRVESQDARKEMSLQLADILHRVEALERHN